MTDLQMHWYKLCDDNLENNDTIFGESNIWRKQLQYLGITIFSNRKCENRQSNAAAVGGEENPSYLSHIRFYSRWDQTLSHSFMLR